MVTSLNTSRAAHRFNYQAINYIRATVNAIASGAVVLVSIGRLPIGAVILGIHSRVSTAFAGGIPLLTLGEATDPGVDNVLAAIAETAGGELLQPLTAFGGPLTAELEVYAQLSGGATSGSATITIMYSNN